MINERISTKNKPRSKNSTGLKKVARVIPDARVSKLRNKRHKERQQYKTKFWAIFCGCMFFLSIGALIWYVYNPDYQISKIEFEGVNSVDSSELTHSVSIFLNQQTYLGLASGRSILTYNENGLIEYILKKYPLFSSVEVAVANNVITLFVTERIHFALWCTLDKDEVISTPCTSLDETLFSFQSALLVTNSETVIFSDRIKQPKIGDRIVPPLTSAHIIKFMDDISKLDLKVSKVQFSEDGTIDISISSPSRLFLNDSRIVIHEEDDLDGTLKNLTLLLEEKSLERALEQEGGETFEYVDLRFDHKIFYKIQGVQQVDSSTSFEIEA